MAEEFDLGKSLLFRFIRGFISGAIASMSVIAVFAGNSWSEIQTWLVALSIAGITGGITGGILALDKFIRSR